MLLINQMIYPSDWLTTVSNRPDLTVYATNNNLNSLSTNSILSIKNSIQHQQLYLII